MAATARVSRMRGQEEEGDRISSLPDVILCHILSFLPTKYSVRTRLVSTRWKYLFAYVPLLDFQYSDEYHCTKKNNSQRRRRFKDYVNRVLMMHDFPQLTKFHLKYFAERLDDIVTWILYAIRHNVQELDLFVRLQCSPNIPKTLPRELFSSKTLSVLKLRGNLSLKLLPSSALLPSLKTLQLTNFSFDLSAQRILSICPALDDLFLYICSFGNEMVLGITNSSLRKLRIEECYGRELILNVPSLVLFEYLKSDFRESCEGNVITSLVEAVIDPNKDMDSAAFLQLLNVVSHARRLYLSMYSFEVFEDCVKAVPTFHKLTFLEVAYVSPVVLELLPEFLNRCSILEVLVFTYGFDHMAFEEVEQIDDDIMHVNDMECYEYVPWCVLRHLKKIEFGAFAMWETEWELVEYFLKNAQVLQEMKIQSKLSLSKQSDLSQKLLAISRFSKDCQIVIENEDEIEDSDDETKDSEGETH